MATEIYKSGTIYLIDGTPLYITPLKIKYLREFMVAFENVKSSKGDEEAISALAVCAAITMQQYKPEIDSVDKLEDVMDLPTVYDLLELSAGIRVKPESEETVKAQAVDSGSSWDDVDLAQMESEAFLLGIWKDYEMLERSLSMPELIATLNSKRELDYEEKKFLAAIQGVDLDKQTGKGKSDPWEEMKARVFSKGQTSDPTDILSYQGVTASKAGFGIGMGLDYEKI
jgi:hypothetical protein